MIDDRPTPTLARAAGVALLTLGWSGGIAGLLGMAVAPAFGAPIASGVAGVTALIGFGYALAGHRLFGGDADDIGWAVSLAIAPAVLIGFVALLVPDGVEGVLLLGSCMTPFVVVAMVAIAGRPGYLAWRESKVRDGE